MSTIPYRMPYEADFFFAVEKKFFRTCPYIFSQLEKFHEVKYPSKIGL